MLSIRVLETQAPVFADSCTNPITINAFALGVIRSWSDATLEVLMSHLIAFENPSWCRISRTAICPWYCENLSGTTIADRSSMLSGSAKCIVAFAESISRIKSGLISSHLHEHLTYDEAQVMLPHLPPFIPHSCPLNVLEHRAMNRGCIKVIVSLCRF